MIKMISAAFLFLLVCLSPGCGSSPAETKVKPPVMEKRLAGRVQRVNTTSGFVLIRRYGIWRVGDHEVVVSQGQGRSANLLPTGERLGEHIAADIRSGEIEVGDAVYIQQISKKLISENAKSSGKPENITPPKN